MWDGYTSLPRSWSTALLRDNVAQPAQRWISKPSSRWIAFISAFIISLWLFASLFQLEMPFSTHSPGQPLPPVDLPPLPSPAVWSARAAEVKTAFRHAYSGYQRYASGYDELLPVSGGKINNFNGWSVSVVDALDTMWMMEMYDDFRDAVRVVAKTAFAPPGGVSANFFETVIRSLGGLLSAYALSGEPIFLSRADELGNRLLPVFNSPSGLPYFYVNTETGDTKIGSSHSVLWSEAMSCQMEYKYLAHLTGRAEYYKKVEKVMAIMQHTTLPDRLGLFPTAWDIASGKPKNSQYSVGARADSAYEYMLKQWLLTGKSEPRGRDMYLAAANGIIKNLMYLSPTRKLLYVTDVDQGNPSHVFEHLSCFLPGLFALAAHTLPLSPRDMELHQWAATGLAKTCWTTYADQATGLGPDEVVMKWEGQDPHAGRWIEQLQLWERQGKVGQPPGLQDVRPASPESRDYTAQRTGYLLRPETVESFYILWRTSGDEIWRERGWSIFEAIQKHSRTRYGYASLGRVDEIPAPLRDEMPSYFLAETLKYLYLLFNDADLVPLDTFVFNTEAHPLPVFNWSPWEREEYDVGSR